MSTKHLLRSFAGGELAPELAGRIDLTKFQTGLSLCRNMIVLPHGPVTRRPGFEFINVAQDSTQPVRLIPFSFSADQTVVLEFGHEYVRFHIDGGTLLETAKPVVSIVGTVVEITAHGYLAGEWVYIGGRFFQVDSAPTANTIDLRDLFGQSITPTGTTAARVYTIASPFDGADVFGIKFTQSADVLTLTHKSYATRELVRNGATDWAFRTVSFAPSIDPPTGLGITLGTSGGTSNGQTYFYVVTAVAADGVTESLASDDVSGFNNLANAGNKNTLTWSGVNGADRYNVYKRRGGSFGYVGQARPVPGTPVAITAILRTLGSKTVQVSTAAPHGLTTGDFATVADTGISSFDGFWEVTVSGASAFSYQSKKTSAQGATTGTATASTLTFIDDNILPDTTQTPPEDIILLNAEAGDYPGTATYYEQRRWFAGTELKPQVVWATRTGTESNLTSSIPARDADGMEFRVASSQYNQIRHLVPLSDLIAFTAGGEYRIGAEGSAAITPTNISVKPQGYSGASDTQPVVTSNSVLYVQAQGSRVREISYNWESNAYRSVDMSIMAPHRFNGHNLVQLAYSRAPDQLLWAVRGDGTLLGMTHVPDQQVYGWHAHDTDGVFESVCVVAEAGGDVLYAVVKRTMAAGTRRYVERLRTRLFTDQVDAFFVDSGLSHSGAPLSTITGLSHLEGAEVHILADGAVHPPRTVTGGQITLDAAYSDVHVGLPYLSDVRTLPLAIESAQAAGQGTVKNVNRVLFRVAQSSEMQAGPTFTLLRSYPARAVADPYGAPPSLRDGDIELSIDPSWNQDGAVCVRQDLPLPLTVLSMTLEVQTGG